MSVENGAIWVPYLLKAMDNMKGMGRNGPWPGGYVEGKPSEIFKRHVYVSPHHYGEDIAGLVELIGVERALFGSDFPHAEGMSAETTTTRKPASSPPSSATPDRDPQGHAGQRDEPSRHKRITDP